MELHNESISKKILSKKFREIQKTMEGVDTEYLTQEEINEFVTSVIKEVLYVVLPPSDRTEILEDIVWLEGLQRRYEIKRR